ncbi:MAG: GAF domain-containing protein, partial [Thermoleophilaceae bacterium]
MDRQGSRSVGRVLFPLAALLLLAGLIAALVLGIEGDLADAGDDVLPLLLGLAALTGVIGWFLERRHADGRAAEADRRRKEAEAQRQQAEEERSARESELEGERRERKQEENEAEERERELRSEAQKRDKDLHQERSVRARMQHAAQAEREWTRELRSQVLRLHRERGALAHTGDVRAMVLQVALELVEADKGLLLSRQDRDNDGMLDFVCHQGFENDPTESALAQEFATRAMKHEDTIREDDSRTVRTEGRTPADEEIDNLLAIPVYIQDDFEGVIICANRDGGFEELDDEVLLSLGDHAGSVLENGRLHGELRSSYMATVRMMADAIEVKDPSLRMHSDEVASYVGAVA